MLLPKEFPSRAEAAFNNRDLDALIALFAEEFVYRDPNGEARGREATRLREENLFRAFPDIKVEMTPFAWTQTTLAMTATMSGTFKGEFVVGDRVLIPTGKRFSFRFAAHFRFEGGYASSEEVFFDRPTLMRTLEQA